MAEKLSHKSFQKNYGKSVSKKASGMFVSILHRKAENAGGKVIEFSTKTTKLSQTCQCGNIIKKPLSQRRHICPVCGIKAQRDLSL
jgi:transposase